MTKEKWDQFFELLTEIVNEEKPVQEKLTIAFEEAANRNAVTVLDEFLTWD